jgi:hypothetical protein
MQQALILGLLVALAGCWIEPDRSLLRDAGPLDLTFVDVRGVDGDAAEPPDGPHSEGLSADLPLQDLDAKVPDAKATPDVHKPDSQPPDPHAEIKSVRSGASSIADTASSVDISISPVLADTKKTVLFYQVSSNVADPNDGAARCFLASTGKVTCDRYGTVGKVNIQWYLAEFKSGVDVQHLEPPCDSSGTTTVTIAKVDPQKTFLLYSSARAGTDFGYDDFETVRLQGATSVEIAINGTGCSSNARSLQVVQMEGTKVTRGLTGTMSGTGLTVSGLPAVSLSRAFLLYTWQTGSSGAVICDRLVRGTLNSATAIKFFRGAGATGCAGVPVPAISWERVELWSGAGVNQLSVAMTGGVGQKEVNLPAAVDTSRTVAFAGGQGEQGQALGEGSYATNDIIGVASGRHVLSSSSKVQVIRDATGGKASWTSYVVEF